MKWKRSKKAQAEAKVKDSNSESDKSSKHNKNVEPQSLPKALHNGPGNPNGVSTIPSILERDRDSDGVPAESRERPTSNFNSAGVEGHARRGIIAVGVGIQDNARGGSNQSIDMFRPYVV